MTFGKRSLRVEALSRRDSLGAPERASAGRALAAAVPPLVQGRTAAYVSIGSEPGTALLLARLDDVLLPVLLPDGDLDWVLFDGELVSGPMGLLEPAGQRLGRDAVADCSLVVVPALAVDQSGTRLGRGGGSYDRALKRTSALVVAALHLGELVEALPAEPHDQPVGAVVLPDRGLVILGSGGPGGMET